MDDGCRDIGGMVVYVDDWGDAAWARVALLLAGFLVRDDVVKGLDYEGGDGLV